jgi:hypothetical protein
MDGNRESTNRCVCMIRTCIPLSTWILNTGERSLTHKEGVDSSVSGATGGKLLFWEMRYRVISYCMPKYILVRLNSFI